MKSSLSYQLLLYLGSYYCLCFISIEVLLLVYKSIILPYQSLTLASEVTRLLFLSNNSQLTVLMYQFVLLVTMGVVEVCRMLSGWKGNLTESTGSVGISLLLLVPAILCSVYILVFQSYVLR